MDASVTISMGSILAGFGFLIQIGLTIGAIAFSHGALNQRVRQVEEKVKDHGLLATSVTRLETEMESVGREIKGLRQDLKLLRFRSHRTVSTPRSNNPDPFNFPGAREWILEDEEAWS